MSQCDSVSSTDNGFTNLRMPIESPAMLSSVRSQIGVMVVVVGVGVLVVPLYESDA